MRGRPRLTDEAAAQEAARVINVAWALRYCPGALPGLGFTRVQAAEDYVKRRRRGRVGKFIGDAIRELAPAENRVGAAVALVLDHGLTHYRAGQLTGADLTNIARGLDAGRAQWEAQREAARARVQALNTQVTDAPP